MSDVPEVSGQEIAIGAWHHVSLEATFCDQKAELNPLRQRLERFERSEAIERLERLSLRPNDAFYANSQRKIKNFRWSAGRPERGYKLNFAFGASTPWNRIRWRRGRGTKAARRSMNSSGSMTSAGHRSDQRKVLRLTGTIWVMRIFETSRL